MTAMFAPWMSPAATKLRGRTSMAAGRSDTNARIARIVENNAAAHEARAVFVKASTSARRKSGCG